MRHMIILKHTHAQYAHFLTSTNEAVPTTVVVHQIVNKSLITHLTVHCVFQCSTWMVDKGLVYITHLPSACALCKLNFY